MKTKFIALIALTIVVGVTIAVFALNENSMNFTAFDFVPNLNSTEADAPKIHTIELVAEQLHTLAHEGPLVAYKMKSHLIEMNDDQNNPEIIDITSNYETNATIPGPTIVVDEGDLVNITLYNNNLGGGCVSLHSHGVHYGIESDGTLGMINGAGIDECAEPANPYTYNWVASKGKAGTWLYHDHTLHAGEGGHANHTSTSQNTSNGVSMNYPFGKSMHGSSGKGLFGALIINPSDAKVEAQIDGTVKKVPIKDLEKEIILFMIGTRFYGMEIDNTNNSQLALWENPNLVAKLNDKVRFHVITLGTDSNAFHKMTDGTPMKDTPEEFHTFHIHGHSWLEQGTNRILDTRTSGPAESMQFVIKAGESAGEGDWMYHCHVFHHMISGMWGKFTVSGEGGPSIPGQKMWLPKSFFTS